MTPHRRMPPHTAIGQARGMRGDPFERMFSTVKELLWRQRQIQPFPCDILKVMDSLLPPEMPAWATVFPRSVMSVEWQNLTHCIDCSRSVVVELDGETGRAFWMRFNINVPSPTQSAAFNMPPTNRYFETVARWHTRASVIHEELKLYQDGLWDFLQRAHHPELVEKHWKELHPFIDFQLHPGQLLKPPDLNKRRIMPLPAEEDRAGIIEVLAASTLLQTVPCDAWVDYEVEE